MLSESRPGRADDSADRLYRGKDCGAGLGICLGVAAAGEALGPEGPRLSASERTEAALDLREIGYHSALGDVADANMLNRRLASRRSYRHFGEILASGSARRRTARPGLRYRWTRKAHRASRLGSRYAKSSPCRLCRAVARQLRICKQTFPLRWYLLPYSQLIVRRRSGWQTAYTRLTRIYRRRIGINTDFLALE